MTAFPRAESRDRVAGAAALAQAGRSAPIKAVLYPLYVTALLAAVYGHTVIRGVVLFVNPMAVAAALSSWQGLAVMGVLFAAALRAAYRIGTRRGPAVPPLPWVDLVVATAVDRSEALRAWWWQAVAALCGVGFIVGVTLGGALWSGGAYGPIMFAACTIGGPVLGFLFAMLWLRGESGGFDRHIDGPPWDRALRNVSLVELRTQAARAVAIDVGMFSGDARAVRLQVSAPITAGRSLRLKAGRPVATMVRRDLLGLRRNPETLLAGVALALAGGAGVGWLVAVPDRPIVLALLVALAVHVSFGVLAEGLRQQADSGGAHPFLGISWSRELGAHLVIPGGLAAVLAVVAAFLVAPAHVLFAGLVCVSLTVLAAGLHMWAAFRGPSPYPAYLPNGRAFALVWYAMPGLAAAVWGLLIVQAVQGGSPNALGWLISPMFAVALGVTRVRRTWTKARH